MPMWMHCVLGWHLLRALILTDAECWGQEVVISTGSDTSLVHTADVVLLLPLVFSLFIVFYCFGFYI